MSTNRFPRGMTWGLACALGLLGCHSVHATGVETPSAPPLQAAPLPANETDVAAVRALGVDTDRPGPGFEPGLSLGRFSSEEAAQRALTDLARKGVRTAHVVQERGNAPAFVLRLPAADAALREQLRALRPVFAGRDVRPCN